MNNNNNKSITMATISNMTKSKQSMNLNTYKCALWEKHF